VSLVEPEDDDVVTIRNYTFLLASLGQGTTLVRGLYRPTFGGRSVPIAAKAVQQDESESFLSHEGWALRILHNRPHPGFAKLRGVIGAREDQVGCEGVKFLVIDDLHCDLGAYIDRRGRLLESEAKVLFRQLASAVAHAHKCHIVLRAIRLEKIFFTDAKQTSLVFADLQGAIVLPTVATDHDDGGKQVHGAVSIDVYALGVVLFVMLTGDYPFTGVGSMRSGVEGDGQAVSAPLEFPPHVSASARQLINRMFDLDALVRPSVHDVLEDSWLQDGEDNCITHHAAVEHPSPARALNPRRRSISLETDTDQQVPEVTTLAQAPVRRHRQRKRKSDGCVPQLDTPALRQKVSFSGRRRSSLTLARVDTVLFEHAETPSPPVSPNPVQIPVHHKYDNVRTPTAI